MRAMTVWLLLACVSPLAGSCAPAGAQSEGPPRVTQRFDPRAVETVDGRILGVDRTPIQDQLAYGVHITVSTDRGRPVSVHLAPGWYLDEKGLRFAPREQVEVRGYRTEVRGEPAIIAEEIKKGGRVVRIRDERGRPLWTPRRAPAPAGSAAPASPSPPR